MVSGHAPFHPTIPLMVKDEKQLLKILDANAQELGFSGVSFRLVKNSKNVNFVYASEHMRSWVKYYSECEYYVHDSVIKESYRKIVPLYWDSESLIKSGYTSEERQMNSDLKDYGIYDGYDIPCHGPMDTFAILILYRNHDAASEKIRMESVSKLHLYFHYFVSRFLEIYVESDNAQSPAALSSAELQCLQLTAKGLIAKDVAKSLLMSVHTVNRHLSQAIKKLGVQNKYQAINMLGIQP